MDVKKINGFTIKDETARQSLEAYKQINDAAVGEISASVAALGESAEQANTANAQAHEQIVSDLTSAIATAKQEAITLSYNSTMTITGNTRKMLSEGDATTLTEAKAYADGLHLPKGELLGTVTGTHSAGSMMIEVEQTEVDSSIELYKIVQCSGVLCSVHSFVDGSGVKGISILGAAPKIVYDPYVGYHRMTYINIVLKQIGGLWRVSGNGSSQSEQTIIGPASDPTFTPLCNTEIIGIM